MSGWIVDQPLLFLLAVSPCGWDHVCCWLGVSMEERTKETREKREEKRGDNGGKWKKREKTQEIHFS